MGHHNQYQYRDNMATSPTRRQIKTRIAAAAIVVVGLLVAVSLLVTQPPAGLGVAVAALVAGALLFIHGEWRLSFSGVLDSEN